MSKKGNKNQPEKKQLQIIDQQKDLMLRALQKKVRNINKKLNEITQLSQKKDLKPEQEQKISKKGQITQQKEKYMEMIEVYKEIAAENQKVIRKTQLNELEDLAAIIALKEYAVDLGFLYNQNVDNLVRILTTPTSSQLTLQDRIKEISTSLIESANNMKLKKNIKQFAEANANNKKKITNEALSNQPQPISPRSEKQREQELKQLEEEEAFEKSQKEKTSNQPLTPQVVIQPQPTTQSNQTKQAPEPLPEVAQIPTSTNETKVDKKQQQVTTEGNQGEDNLKTTQNQNRQGDRRQNRGYRGGRGGRGRNPRDYDGQREEGKEGGRNYDQRRYNKKPNFKPKYENEKPKDRSSSSSSSSSEPQARQFKREQVRQLIQDGFIVVGKPKVKARDQKQYHDHQHGNKHHKHHSKKNY